MNKPIVIGIGELLWDMLPSGKQLGGAPCNFVYHAQKMGAEGVCISAIGKDELGLKIIDVLQSKGLSTSLIQKNTYPTSKVDVALDPNGVPHYTIHQNVAWDFIEYTSALEDLIAKAHVVCFGSLAQRCNVSQMCIAKALKKCKPECIIIFDINLRQKYFTKKIIESSLHLCNILKLNEDELPIVSDLLNIEGDISQQLSKLRQQYNLDLIAYTQGACGSYLISSTEESFMPTPIVEVKDTVGAGDAFTAAMVMQILDQKSLKDIHQKAVDISAFVCTQNGAMPEY